MVKHAIDCSNYSGILNAQQVTELATYDLVIVRASLETGRNQNGIARQQFGALLGRVPLQAYAWCYWDWSPESTIAETAQLLAPYRDGYYRDPALGQILWLDAEDVPSGDVVAWLRTAGKACLGHGYTPGIYTGGWWVHQYNLDLYPFRDWPLWAAEYDNQPRLDLFHPFAGWTRAYMKQYDGDAQIETVGSVDLNVFEPSAEEDDPMANDFEARLKALEGWRQAGIEADWVPRSELAAWQTEHDAKHTALAGGGSAGPHEHEAAVEARVTLR